MKLLSVTVGFLLPFAVSADLVLDNRLNDPGYMTPVAFDDVQVVKTLNFNDLGPWDKTKDDFFWDAVLEGMTTKCLETTRNPCFWDDTEGCFRPIGRIFDEPKPTLPFTPTLTETRTSVMTYDENSTSPLMPGTFPVMVNFARGGCGDLGVADWGDGPWSIVFDQPYTAVCFDIRFVERGKIRRQHFNFWRDNNGVVEMVGHQDWVGEPGGQRTRGWTDATDRRLCWASEVPFEAVTTWQDGPGAWFMQIHVGNAATTECERATRDADDAADKAAQICEAE